MYVGLIPCKYFSRDLKKVNPAGYGPQMRLAYEYRFVML
jgi:hypothetical protein